MAELPERVREFLRRHGAPASSLLLAQRFLKILPPTESIGARLLGPLLEPAGLTYLPETGWWFTSSVELESGRDDKPVGEGAGHVEGAVSEAFGDRDISPRQVACAVHLSGGGSHRARPIASLCLRGVVGHCPVVSRADWPAISSLLDGAEAIFIDPKLEAPPLLAGLSRRRLPGPAAVRSLAAAVRGSARIPRRSGVEEIAHILGAALYDGETASDAAATVAACLAAAAIIRSQRASVAPGSRSGSRSREGSGDGARVLTPMLLAGVPARPGVYRFFDEKGRLLYVGKAANLRRRLGAYAATGAGAAGSRVTRALSRLARVEIEEAGSELEALLKEARLIRRRKPLDNIQREVHERGRAYAAGRMVALILPSKTDGVATVIFLRDGRYEGSARLGPNGGGVTHAAAILKRLFSPAEIRRASRATAVSVERDTGILNSWLARNDGAVSRVDLDSSPDAGAALLKLESAARDHVAERGSITLHR